MTRPAWLLTALLLSCGDDDGGSGSEVASLGPTGCGDCGPGMECICQDICYCEPIDETTSSSSSTSSSTTSSSSTSSGTDESSTSSSSESSTDESSGSSSGTTGDGSG